MLMKNDITKILNDLVDLPEEVGGATELTDPVVLQAWEHVAEKVTELFVPKPAEAYASYISTSLKPSREVVAEMKTVCETFYAELTRAMDHRDEMIAQYNLKGAEIVRLFMTEVFGGMGDSLTPELVLESVTSRKNAYIRAHVDNRREYAIGTIDPLVVGFQVLSDLYDTLIAVTDTWTRAQQERTDLADKAFAQRRSTVFRQESEVKGVSHYDYAVLRLIGYTRTEVETLLHAPSTRLAVMPPELVGAKIGSQWTSKILKSRTAQEVREVIDILQSRLVTFTDGDFVRSLMNAEKTAYVRSARRDFGYVFSLLKEKDRLRTQTYFTSGKVGTYCQVLYELRQLSTAPVHNLPSLRQLVAKAIFDNEPITLLHFKCLRYTYPAVPGGVKSLQILDHMETALVPQGNGEFYRPRGEGEFFDNFDGVSRVFRKHGIKVKTVFVGSKEELEMVTLAGNNPKMAQPDTQAQIDSALRYYNLFSAKADARDMKFFHLFDFLREAEGERLVTDFQKYWKTVYRSLMAGQGWGIMRAESVEHYVNDLYEHWTNHYSGNLPTTREYSRHFACGRLTFLLTLWYISLFVQNPLWVMDDRGTEGYYMNQDSVASEAGKYASLFVSLRQPPKGL